VAETLYNADGDPVKVPVDPNYPSWGDPPAGSGIVQANEKIPSPFTDSPAYNIAELEREIKLQKGNKDNVALLQSEIDKLKGTVPQAPKLLDADGNPMGTPDWAKAKHQTEGEIAVGGARAAGVAVAKSVADFGDMILAVPGMVMGSVAEVASLTQSMAEGLDRRVAARIGKTVREGVTSEFSPTVFGQLVGWVGSKLSPETAVDPSTTQEAMTLVGEGLAKGGKWVEQKTGGVILAETFEGLVNEGMALGGLKGAAAAGAKKLGPEGKAQTAEATRAAVQKGFEKGAKGQTTVVPSDAADAARPTVSAYTDLLKGKLFDENGVEIPQAVKPAEVPAGAPDIVSSGLDKIKAGRFGEVTPEELSAVAKDAAKPTEAVTPVDVAKVAAVGGAAAALATMYPEKDATDLASAVMTAGAVLLGKHADFAAKPEGSALGVMLEGSPNTLKTLERLPQNRAEFSKQMIEEQLKRPDVTKAEKEVFRTVLDAVQGDSISAKQLVLGFKEATGDFELKAEDTQQYANYGIDAIRDPNFSGGGDGLPMDVREGTLPPAKTTLYTLPDSLNIPASGHFPDSPGLFGWTRSFEEGGKIHVVELQSDLFQHLKELKPEEALRLLIEAAQLKVRIGELDALYKKYPTNAEIMDAIHADAELKVQLRHGENNANFILTKASKRIQIRLGEIDATLTSSGASSKLQLVTKDWPKRLVREELARTAREQDVTLPSGETVKAPRSVRFATADTVAKVERWPRPLEQTKDRLRRAQSNLDGTQAAIDRVTQETPSEKADIAALERDKKFYSDLVENERSIIKNLEGGKEQFSPEHQSIYNRYRDIEKFLRGLGGQPYTDVAGHTWIEVPTQPGPSSRRAATFGGADPATLAKIAVVAGAVALGTSLDKDHPIQGGLLGFLGGAAITSGVMKVYGQRLREALAPDKRIRIDDAGNQHEYTIERMKKDMWKLRKDLSAMVPDKGRREAITAALDTGDITPLRPAEMPAYNLAKNFFDAMKHEGLGVGVLTAARENYITHLWDFKDQGGFAPGMSPSSRFAKARTYTTLAEGEAAGLKPLTKDVAEIAEIYGNSMGRSIANRQLLNTLKDAKTIDGAGLVQKVDDAPHSYVRLNNPALQGWRVHPDIAPSMKFLFEQGGGNAAIRGVEAFNTTVKRMAVSFSLFHAKALLDAGIAAAAHPGIALKSLGQAAIPKLFGENIYLKQLREVGVGPTIDMALKGGLKFSLEHGLPGVEDVGTGFYEGMRGLSSMMDKAIPGAHLGKGVEGFTKFNHAFDNFMWGRLHAGIKLSTFADRYGRLLENGVERDAAAKMAASYTNDMFGGLNWRRIAEGTKSKFGRDAALAALSPNARRLAQVALFAPDWTLSTTRAFTQALGKGTGFKGLVKPTTLADLHRQYVGRAALYYLAIGTALNEYYTGRPLWEGADGNPRDWTRIDMGDERTMQWSKHTMEPVHWFTQPRQQLLNKLGYIPKEGLSQTFGVEYLAPRTDARTGQVSAGPPMQEGRVQHVLKSLSPIGVQQFRDSGIAAGLSGMLGIPIYGKTEEERAHDKAQRAIDRALKGAQ
jgi:hypothetical protein